MLEIKLSFFDGSRCNCWACNLGESGIMKAGSVVFLFFILVKPAEAFKKLMKDFFFEFLGFAFPAVDGVPRALTTRSNAPLDQTNTTEMQISLNLIILNPPVGNRNASRDEHGVSI